MRRPIIGISSSYFVDNASHGSFNRHSVTAGYSMAVAQVGGAPIILPFIPDAVETYLELIDGLILSGGSDIDPARFGDTEVHPATYDIIPDRDEAEIRLVEGAAARSIPILGICRGIQAIAVALGGSLIQDVPSQISTDIEHRQHNAGIEASEPGHDVSIVPGSRVAEMYGTERQGVNSFHHQSVKRAPERFVVTARSDDGVIEAIETTDDQFIVGLQWHPEIMFEVHDEHLSPFVELVEAARVHSLTRV